jgi:hypothetical protein
MEGRQEEEACAEKAPGAEGAGGSGSGTGGAAALPLGDAGCAGGGAAAAAPRPPEVTAGPSVGACCGGATPSPTTAEKALGWPPRPKAREP